MSYKITEITLLQIVNNFEFKMKYVKKLIQFYSKIKENTLTKKNCKNYQLKFLKNFKLRKITLMSLKP